MKKVLNACFLVVMLLFSSIIIVACNNEDNIDYSPQLSKSYSANGFTIKTTDDFTLQSTDEGISLISEGDNLISFNNTYIQGQYDIGNTYYNFEEISLEKYISDILKIEKCNLQTPNYVVLIEEKTIDNFTRPFNLSIFVHDKNMNQNGNYDWYNIYCFGKASNSFVYFKIETMIQDKYYDQNITKLFAIIGSIGLTKPIINNSYNNSVTNYISSTMKQSADIMASWNFKFIIPDDYVAYTNPAGNYYNYLATPATLEETDWDSSIRCDYMAVFMDETILNDNGIKHLINFSKNNYLGFYTKSLSENSDNTISTFYNFYYLNDNYSLNENYIKVYVSCSEELNLLGFKNYFEEQLFSWIQNLEILA